MSLLRRLEHAARGQYGIGSPSRPPAPAPIVVAEDIEAPAKPSFPVAPPLDQPTASPPNAPDRPAADQAEALDAQARAIAHEQPELGPAPKASLGPVSEPSLPVAAAETPIAKGPSEPKDPAPPVEQVWNLVVPPPAQAATPLGPLMPTVRAAQHLAKAVPEPPAKTSAEVSEPAAPETIEVMVSPALPARHDVPPQAAKPVAPAQILRPVTPEPNAPTLSIGQVDIRIAPPPPPPQSRIAAPAPPPVKEKRHAKGLSVSSQLRRAGLRRL